MILRKIKESIKWLYWVYKSNKVLKSAVKAGNGIICDRIKIRIDGHVNIGKKVVFYSKGIDCNTRSQVFVSNGSTLTIGNHSGFTSASINCTCGITIGDYVKIGAGCLIMDSDFHSINWRLRCDSSKDSKYAKSKPIVIDNHVFIGARSIICKGVHIGEHSIIAAGSVVVSDIPSNCIAGGNPCRVIKTISFD